MKPRAKDAEDATKDKGSECGLSLMQTVATTRLIMTENQLGKRILDFAFEIHIELGPGS